VRKQGVPARCWCNRQATAVTYFLFFTYFTAGYELLAASAGSSKLVRFLQQVAMTPSNRNISLRGLRTFCVAAEHASFRVAAERLFITASAVSHQIKNLEEELGQKLFDRTSRSLTLTDAGRSLLDDMKPLITRLDEVAARHRAAATRSTLSISVQPFFASEVFIPKLPEFTRDHPDIDIRVDTMSSDRLFPLRLVPAASPELRKKMVVDNESIVGDVPLLVHDNRPKAWRQWQQSSGVTIPRDASIIRLDSMIAIARAAERGLGAALVPVQLSDAWFESGSLVALSDHELVTRDAYYFVCRPGDAGNETIQTLRSWVLQNFDDSR
jgi:LysR family glycine cleavage system transcriptional activator